MRSIESPCTGVCRLDPRGEFCLGCKRSLDEIADWSMLSDAEKRAVLTAVKQRT
jgi:predicted Fe-S protein YdhL (DUF1289 family)